MRRPTQRAFTPTDLDEIVRAGPGVPVVHAAELTSGGFADREVAAGDERAKLNGWRSFS